MSIAYYEQDRFFHLKNEHFSYCMRVDDHGHLWHLYYGAPIGLTGAEPLVNYQKHTSFWSVLPGEPNSIDTVPLEYPGSGTADLRPCALTTVDAGFDGVTDLRFDSYEILAGKPHIDGLPQVYLNEGEIAETLKITLKDSVKELYADLYYTLFGFSGALSRFTVIRNGGHSTVRLQKAMTATLSFGDKDFELIHLHGAWGREFELERTPLTKSVQTISSFRGSSSHTANPFAALVRPDTTEDSGEAYGMSIIYSSNFEIETETDTFDCVRVNIGINERGFEWTLNPGESFTTPEAIFVYSANGLTAMSQTYQKLYQNNLIRGYWRDRLRPVLLNSWEGVSFHFDGEKMRSMARASARMGVDLFVVDDGWFGLRDNDHCALGDWVPNEPKLGGTLGELVKYVNDLGMDFGLWFEPEMISEDSDLYRAHPGWAIKVPNRAASLGRHQMILDLTRADVREYIVSAVTGVLRSANIVYVKWDMNRNMSEIGSEQLPGERNGEFFHRYILGLYEVLERITTEFPHILFESCSGGGGRFDPGMAYYMPQNWTSDNTDAIARLHIQYGCSMVYPPSLMTCHVSKVPNGRTKRVVPFETRANVAMQGSFGYEFDPSLLTDEQIELIHEEIKEYKQYADLVLHGRFYRLVSPFTTDACAFETVAEDKSVAIATYVFTAGVAMTSRRRLRLKGLDADAVYTETHSGQTYSGSFLMNAGILLPAQRFDFDSVRYIFERRS